ncbi:uncharacterized protein I206_104752 [Kwoniella pini CBS 10737]|uniref:FHF complex subunit HOOK-interacting protein C-terminal domain-containing protein n=1 Tax=Kwoniella pini CBS 10737 TaxID=1296096 RepID=A0A1B9I7N9_9TREE|nr:uncharacterized protein I206_02290 [Kwoniella pini CBS 10737]OCF51575.1 hypothetical protein I206_02290 [Kwoniella pini CBS 10737]
MEVTNFFTRLLQTSKEAKTVNSPDDLEEFDDAWQGIKETLEQPDERQLVRGISSTQVPNQLRHIVDALAYESNRTDEDTTGACLEYFLKNDLLGQLERLCEPDRPYGIKAEVLRAINNLIVSLSERFLVHNAVHRPLRRLLRSCIGEEPEEKVDGKARVVGAAGMDPDLNRRGSNEDIEEDLVGLMCTLASRMVAYPPLLLIFFHDKGWLQPHPMSTTTMVERALSPAPSGQTGISGPSSKVSTHHFEFLLFSYLLRFAHREGQIGDPARAGLLFLFDIAFLPSSEIGTGSPQIDNTNVSDPLQDARNALGEFILDGDFAEVMAAGLGAIYSLLPSKLYVPTLAELAELDKENVGTTNGGMFLGTSSRRQDTQVPYSTDSEVRDQLDLILQLFGFLQDIIHRCTSAIYNTDNDLQGVSATHLLGSAIAESTIDAIHSSFLDNVLYPSILECSNHDGSSVAVLTYLDVLLSNLDEGPLLSRLMSFLMDNEPNDNHQIFQNRGKTKKKTGAMEFIFQTDYTATYYADEGRFTLKDLILDNLHSSNPPSVTAALCLLRALFSNHCFLSVKDLLSVIPDPTATELAKCAIPSNTGATSNTFLPNTANSSDVHLQEVDLYSSLLAGLDPSISSAEVTAGYAIYLTDMTALIEADRCFRSATTPVSFLNEMEKNILRSEMLEGVSHHRLNPSDKLIQTILYMLSNFLGNDPDENVALTGVITIIALCPTRSLAGWILYDKKPEEDPWKQQNKKSYESLSNFDSDSDDESESDMNPLSNTFIEQDPYNSRRSTTLPAIYQILQKIIKTISHYRSTIDSFDDLLAERRQGLLFTDRLDEAMNIMLDVETSSVFGMPETSKSEGKKKRPSAADLVGGIKSFLTPKRKPPTPLGTPNKSSGLTPTLGNLFNTSSNIKSNLDSDNISTPPRRTLSLNSNVDITPNQNLKTPIKVDELDMLYPSPFKSHYEQSDIEIIVESIDVPIMNGPWSITDHTVESNIPALDQEISYTDSPFRTNHFEDSQHTDGAEGRQGKGKGPKKVSLNVILDNCIILEEFIKEIVAIITARRAMGIDQVALI